LKSGRNSNGLSLNTYRRVLFAQSMQRIGVTALASATGMVGGRRRRTIPSECKVKLKGVCMSREKERRRRGHRLDRTGSRAVVTGHEEGFEDGKSECSKRVPQRRLQIRRKGDWRVCRIVTKARVQTARSVTTT
jgi:hypothetical protein